METSGHIIDLKDLWRELDTFEKELNIEERALQDVWCKIADLKIKGESDARMLLEQPELKFISPTEIVRLNIGGQVFELEVEILTRDPYSILAACCRLNCPISKDVNGFFYFERDWWLFRHIIAYLRSHVLPNDMDTLKELYMEALYYRLYSLQKVIEDLPVNQIVVNRSEL